MKTSMVKIDFEMDPHQEWHGQSHEGLWGEPLHGARSDTVFTIKNSPFYVKGVSFMDIVEAHPAGKVGRVRFHQIIQKGGHSTYRLALDKANSDFPDWWSRLQGLGCTYESTHLGNQRILYAVDVPDTSDIYAVYDVLVQGERNLIWLIEEGDVGHDLSQNRKPSVSS
jgi:Domain of unknown function (DUF4265)